MPKRAIEPELEVKPATEPSDAAAEAPGAAPAERYAHAIRTDLEEFGQVEVFLAQALKHLD